jgi:mannose-6-phosphate isomerase-like protein (cupin superfamily)
MIHSKRAWMILLAVLVLAGALVLPSSRPSAQASPPAAEFPKSITVSPGPKTNLFPHLMTKAEVLAALAQVKDSQDLVVKTNFAITLRAASNTTKLPWKVHTEADELWFVYRGSAKVSLAPFSLQLGVTPPGNTYDAAEGDIVNVPRHMAYQVMPAGRFEYVAVRKFLIPPARRGGGAPAAGGGGTPPAFAGTPPTIVTKAQIDKIYATATASVPVYAGITANLYNGGPDGVKWGPFDGGPVENHERDEHLYIATYGTGKAYMDGFIANGHWDRRGVMGLPPPQGSTEYTMHPGDMLFVFRNTLHYIVPIPTTGKVGYFLVSLNGMTAEQSLPKAIVPNGAGAY